MILQKREEERRLQGRGGEERGAEKRRGEGRGWRRKHIQLLSMLLHLLYWVHKYVRAKADLVASLLTWNTLIILQLEITPITHCIITLGDNTHKGPAICINKNSRGFNIKNLSFIKLQTPVCFTCWTYVSLSPSPPTPPLAGSLFYCIQDICLEKLLTISSRDYYQEANKMQSKSVGIVSYFSTGTVI